jgi:uncharacterized protein YndB with AHSA1/START domain
MNEAATGSATAIVVDYDLTAAPAIVWRALTESDLIASWLMENDFQAVVGHRFSLRAQPMPGWDGIVQCEVLEVDEPHRLAYSWRGGPEEHRLDTVVTWTLAPDDAGGTRLHLEHTGFTANDRFALEGMGRGWRGHIGARLAQVNGTMG